MPRKRGGTGCLQVLLSVAVGLMIVLALAAGGLAYLYLSDWALPGVNSLGVELGGKTAEKAAAALEQEWQSRSIVVSDGSTTWTLSPGRLGILLDTTATVEQALAQGRSPSTLGAVLEKRGRIAISPVWRFDRSTADALLRVMAGQIQVPPENASVRVVDGRVETVAAKPGRTLDVNATLAWLEQNTWDVVTQRHLQLAVIPLEPAITDLGPAIERANNLLSAPLTLRLYDPFSDERLEWRIPPAAIGNWLVVRSDPANPKNLDWAVDGSRVEAYLKEQGPAALGQGRYVEAQEAVQPIIDSVIGTRDDVFLRAYHHTRTHTVQPGETYSSIAIDYGVPYPWIQQANPAVGDALRAGQTINIPSPDVFLPLPPVENKRIRVSLSKQRVWVYEDGKVKWEWPASTGMASSPTTPGVYQVQSHEPNAYAANWDLWMPHFMGIYRPVPESDFMNGFHGFPKRGGSQILWTGDLGRRVTYGCILISSDNAKALYEWAEEGVVVVIEQ